MKAASVLIAALALTLGACGSTSSTTTSIRSTGGAPSSGPSAATSTPTSATGFARTTGSAPATTSAPGTGTTATSAQTPTTIASATSATATSTATSSSYSTSSTTAGVGLGFCRAAGLELSFLGQQGATGHGELGFSMRNTSGHSCQTIGYPGVLFLGRSGSPLPTLPARVNQDFFGDAPLRPLQVTPGATASFRLGVTHGIATTAGCTTAYGLQVIPPNDTATIRVAIPGGAYECRGVTVTPVQPGNSAYP